MLRSTDQYRVRKFSLIPTMEKFALNILKESVSLVFKTLLIIKCTFIIFSKFIFENMHLSACTFYDRFNQN